MLGFTMVLPTPSTYVQSLAKYINEPVYGFETVVVHRYLCYKIIVDSMCWYFTEMVLFIRE